MVKLRGPLKPLDNILPRSLKGFRAAIHCMGPHYVERRQSLGQLYACARCRNYRLVQQLGFTE